MDKTYLILLTHPRCSMNSKTIQAKRATKPNENRRKPQLITLRLNYCNSRTTQLRKHTPLRKAVCALEDKYQPKTLHQRKHPAKTNVK